MSKIDEVRSAARKVLEAVREAYGKIKKERGFLAEIRAAIKIVPAAVREVESVARGLDLRGVDKKELAVEAIMSSVKLPWFVPRAPVKKVLGDAIDSVVEGINQKLKKA